MTESVQNFRAAFHGFNREDVVRFLEATAARHAAEVNQLRDDVKRLEEELALYQRENELHYHYYEELDRKYRESRKVIHDMKNHLQAVEDLYAGQKTEAGDRYVKDLYHMLNVLGEKRYTENQMLNIILNEKIREAEAKGITVTVRVGDIDLSDIKEIDLTTIFANLLDNAIEAAGEDGRLSIKLDEFREFRVGEIRNSIQPELKKKEGHMGLGLGNVRNTLEKYHGTMKTEETKEEFQVRLMLPMEKR